MSKFWDEILMSHANNSNEIQSDVDKCSVNDNDQINTASGKRSICIVFNIEELCQFFECLSFKIYKNISTVSGRHIWVENLLLQIRHKSLHYSQCYKCYQCIENLANEKKSKHKQIASMFCSHSNVKFTRQQKHFQLRAYQN